MTDDLIKGAQEFKHYNYERDNVLMKNLSELGQDPKYFIISCIDSRCDPGIIFRAKPGTFFTHKAMGAIVRPYKAGTALAAALQFALKYNNVETIIVLGHTQCGAIKALGEGINDPEISSFVNVAQNALTKAKACCSDHQGILRQTEKETILESAENLKSYPSVSKTLASNRITIKSWQFDMKSGDLKEYNPSTQDFESITGGGLIKDNRKKEDVA